MLVVDAPTIYSVTERALFVLPILLRALLATRAPMSPSSIPHRPTFGRASVVC